jgi:hypothetical protein
MLPSSGRVAPLACIKLCQMPHVELLLLLYCLLYFMDDRVQHWDIQMARLSNQQLHLFAPPWTMICIVENAEHFSPIWKIPQTSWLCGWHPLKSLMTMRCYLSIGLFAVCSINKIKNFIRIERIKIFARIAVCYPLFPQQNHCLSTTLQRHLMSRFES